MAINVILSQVVGQAFIVKANGEVITAAQGTRLQTGDVISVPKGRNSWLVTEEDEQIDVLDEALLARADGFEPLEFPSDVLDIIAAIEEGDDPSEVEGTETAAGEGANGSAIASSVVIDYNGATGALTVQGFDTTGFTAAGLTEEQVNALVSARFSPAVISSQEEGEETRYIPPTFSDFAITSQEDGDIVLTQEAILSAISGGDTANLQVSGIQSSVEGTTITQNTDGSFTLTPPPNYNGDLVLTLDVTDGQSTVQGDINISVTDVEDTPDLTLTPVTLTEDDNVSEGSVVATVNTHDGDGDPLIVSITNDPDGYFDIVDGTVVLTEAGAAAVDDDTLNLNELNITVSVTDGNTITEETITVPITRTDDDATLEGDTEATVTDSTGSKAATVSGQLTVVDPDSNHQTTLVNDTYNGEFGTLVVENGQWVYTVDKEAVAPLGEGEQTTDTITITASDGSTHQIVLSIEGTNDPASVSGDITATLIDNGGTMATSGTLAAVDVDGNDNTFIAETVTTLRGQVTIDQDGNWTYTTDDPTGAIQRLPEGETLTEIVTVRTEDGTEQQIVLTLQGVNDTPVFSAIYARDVYEENGVISVSGTLNVADPDHGQYFMEANTYVGEFGSVTMDRAGNWTYTTDPAQNAALDSLKEGEQRVDAITVRSQDGTETQVLVTIIGTNDPAAIAGDIIGTVIEADGTMTTSGQLTSTDVDGNDNAFIPQTIEGRWGELTIGADGNWTYRSNDEKGAIDRLGDGDHLTDTLTVQAEDGTRQTLTLTINGTNDAAVFTGNASATLNETDSLLTTRGSINVWDADYDEYFFEAGTFGGAYGDVTIDRAGNWTYTTDPSKTAALDALEDGEQLVDTVTVRSLDGTETDILITITGTNDPARIAGDITGTVVEADGTMTTSGQLTSTDVDGNDNAFTPQSVQGRWGELTIDKNGNWTYRSNDEKGAIDRLGEGDQLTDTLSVRAEDGTVQAITITIDGTNDAAVFGGMTNVTVNETDSPLTARGRVTVSDADHGEYFFQTGTYTGTYGEVTLDKAGNWRYASFPEHTATFDALDDGDELRETVTVFSQDGTPLTISITVKGTDDLPVVSGETKAALADNTTGEIQTVSGTLTITDADDDDSPRFDDVTIESDYGLLEMVGGNWTYTLNKDAASHLNAGETDTDVITLVASDGTQQTLVISVTGTDDEPVLKGNTIGSVSDNDTPTASGFINIVDPDSEHSPTLADTTVSGEHGTLTLVDGAWTYTLNPDAATALPEGETMLDVVTLTASDGSTHDITITITGTDQEPVMTGRTTGEVTEGTATLTATGRVELVDIDTGEHPTLPNGTTAGQYGSLMLVDGNWTYTLDPELAQYLDKGQSTTDTISVTASDGTVHDIVITITGSEDAAVLSGDTTGGVTDEASALTATGFVSVNDPDASDNPTLPDSYQQGQYGTFSMVEGNWRYDLDSELAAVLDEGVTVTDTITVTDSLGASYDIVITVTGTDNAAVISGTVSGDIDAAAEPAAGEDAITTSGTLSVSDADSNDDPSFNATTQEGTYGTFELVGNAWTYTLDPEKAKPLDDGETAQEVFTVTASDGTTQAVTINVTGSEDAAVLNGDTAATVSAAGPTTETVTVDRNHDGTWDVGNGDNLYLNLGNITSNATSSNSVGYYVVDANGDVIRAAIIFDNAHYVNNTSVNINTAGGEKVGLFMIPDGDSKGFNVGSVNLSVGSHGVMAYQGWAYGAALVSESSKNGGYDYEANQGTYAGWEDTVGGGDRDFNDVTFYITATQQQTQPVAASGTVSVADIDNGDNPTLPDTTVQGEFGTLVLVNGHWTYTFDESKAQQISEETRETIVITDSEGGQHEIVITLQGTDDAPVVTGVFTGAVREGDIGDIIKVSGHIAISDPDIDDTPAFPNTTVQGDYGSLTLVDGVWTYELDNTKAEALSASVHVTDTLTLTATDGTVQEINISISGTDDAPFVVGTNSGTVVAPDTITREYVDIGQVFWLNDGYSFPSGNMQHIGSEPRTLNFHKEATTVRIYDTDSVMHGDGTDWQGTNEYVYDTTQKVEINGVFYNVNFDYTIDYVDAVGNVYTFGVADIDIDGDRWHRHDPNEQGNFIIQLSGPQITTGTQLRYVPTQAERHGSLQYQDIAVEYDDSTIEARGSLAMLDVDASDTSPVFADTIEYGRYGSLVLTDGNWTYTLDPRSTPTLGDNDTLTETITLTATNGAQTQVNITIGGSESAFTHTYTVGSGSALDDVIALDDITFQGSDSSDRFAGSSDTDVILGNAGHDVIHGNAGDDIIDGGLGDDLLFGGKGNDLLAGGAGSDTYAFLQGDQGEVDEPAVDHIADFNTQQDTINLSDLLNNETVDTLDSYLSMVDDGEGHAMLNISTQGDGHVDQQVVFDNISVDEMASAYSIDISGMTSEQISASVIDTMIMQSKMIID